MLIQNILRIETRLVKAEQGASKQEETPQRHWLKVSAVWTLLGSSVSRFLVFHQSPAGMGGLFYLQYFEVIFLHHTEEKKLAFSGKVCTALLSPNLFFI